MRPSRDFFKPLAAGAPAPVQEIPFKPSRVIHFFPPHNEKMVAKLPDTIPNVDIILGNLEDAIPMADKAAARAALSRLQTLSTSAPLNCGHASTASTLRGSLMTSSTSSLKPETNSTSL